MGKRVLGCPVHLSLFMYHVVAVQLSLRTNLTVQTHQDGKCKQFLHSSLSKHYCKYYCAVTHHLYKQVGAMSIICCPELHASQYSSHRLHKLPYNLPELVNVTSMRIVLAALVPNSYSLHHTHSRHFLFVTARPRVVAEVVVYAVAGFTCSLLPFRRSILHVSQVTNNCVCKICDTGL